MILLQSSKAQHVFWLGRYLTRIQYLCSQFPFYDNQAALQYAHAFCLPAFDASSLNVLLFDEEQPSSFAQQFQAARHNIQALDEVFSAQTYSELKQLIHTADNNTAYICEVAAKCKELIELESEDIFIFFSLGQNIEQLNRQIRLKQDQTATLIELDKIITLLSKIRGSRIKKVWQQLKSNPDSTHFYHFSDHIENLFELSA